MTNRTPEELRQLEATKKAIEALQETPLGKAFGSSLQFASRILQGASGALLHRPSRAPRVLEEVASGAPERGRHPRLCG
jgi:hypothetical protein